MGKLLKVLGVVFLIGVAGVVALLLWSHKKGEETQAGFFRAVQSGDVQQVLDRFHPEMLELVDPAPLKVWMDALSEHLGEFKELSGSNFSTSTHTEGGRTLVKSEGTVIFAKGEARSILHLVDDKVIKFELTADKLPNPWMTRSPVAGPYIARATTFMRHLIQGQVAEARALMHEALRAEISEQDLEQGLAALRDQLGDGPSIEAGAPEFSATGTPTLRLPFTVKGSESTAEGHVTFQFTPWKGHMIAFRLRPSGS